MAQTTPTSAPQPDAGTWQAVTGRGASALQTITAHPADVLLACDFDGTLAPIVANPLDSRLHPRSRAALDRLGRALGQVAVITGREVAVVRQLARFDQTPGLSRLVVLGQYGQERYDAATGRLDVPEAPAAVRDALADLTALLASADTPVDLAGVTLEDKGRAIGVHTRRATDPQAALDWLRDPVAAIAGAHGLLVEPGRHVLEVRSSATTKGDALAALAAETGARVVVMMGDDLGDIAAFTALDQLEATGVAGVRVVAASPEQPAVAAHADILCGGPDGIAAWLTDLADHLDC